MTFKPELAAKKLPELWNKASEHLNLQAKVERIYCRLLKLKTEICRDLEASSTCLWSSSQTSQKESLLQIS